MSIIQCPRCQSRYDSALYRPGDQVNCRCGQSFYSPRLPNLAKSWNCPSCGGAASPTDKTCEYCGVYLSFARCPACFSVAAYQGAKFCAECGESLTKPAKAMELASKGYRCPRCKTPELTYQKTGEYSIDGCDACGGVWLDHTVLDKLLATANIKKNTQAMLGKTVRTQTTLKRHKVSYLPCPECSTLMHRRNFAKRSGIIVDECAAHGIWFDRDELAAIIDYVRSSPQKVEYTGFEGAVETSLLSPARTVSKKKKTGVFDVTPEDLENLIREFPLFFR